MEKNFQLNIELLHVLILPYLQQKNAKSHHYVDCI